MSAPSIDNVRYGGFRSRIYSKNLFSLPLNHATYNLQLNKFLMIIMKSHFNFDIFFCTEKFETSSFPWKINSLTRRKVKRFFLCCLSAFYE